MNRKLNFIKGILKDIVKIGGKEREITVDTDYKTDMGGQLLNLLNYFEERSWTSSMGGLKSGFPMLDKAFCDGFVPAFYVIAGDSNVGKSTLLTQITYQMLELNENIFIMDFSLDDPLPDKLARLIGSWVKMDSNEVKYPANREDEVIERRKLGMYKMANCKDKYLPYDVSFGNDIYKIEQEIAAVKSKLPQGTKLVVTIDSFHDLGIDSEPSLSETAKFNKVAQWAADLAIKEDLVLLCTCELRKAEKDGARATLGLLRESVKIRYEAKAIMLVHNDVHYNGDSAEIFFNNPDDNSKLPVFEVHIAKNKVSSFKGRLFYYMWPAKGYLQECTSDTMKAFRDKI